MVKLNDIPALETLLEEVYVDAGNQISDTNELLNYLSTMAVPSDIDDLTKIAKEKTAALKVKEGATRLKLDISKLMNDVIKQSKDDVDVEMTASETSFEDNSAFDAVRDMLAKEMAEMNKKQ